MGEAARLFHDEGRAGPRRLTPAGIRRGIFVFAAALLAGLMALRFAGIDRTLLAILAAAAGLLVALLLITYRAFAGVVEAARNLPPEGSPPEEDDEDAR